MEFFAYFWWRALVNISFERILDVEIIPVKKQNKQTLLAFRKAS